MHVLSRRRIDWFVLAAVSLLLTAAASFSAGTARAEDVGMRAALLTSELGDPKEPGNLKLVLTLPPELAGPGATLNAEAFQVHVHPDDVSPADGKAARYRAGGLYYWRDGSKIFLDVRSVPKQDGECRATVRVAYAPEGKVLADSVLFGEASYTNQNVDVVLAVDVSLSMNYKDPEKRRVAAARTFLDMAGKAGGVGRVALVTFNHEAHLVTPLIPLEQGERLLADLDNVGAEGLTNLDNPIDYALQELKDSRRPVIILLTDGKNEGHDYADAHHRAAERGVRIFAVGLSEQADHDLLKKMAEDTNGIYFRAIDDKDLPEIYARLAAELGKRHLVQSRILVSESGMSTYPIDGSIRRMVAFADNGARVQIDGPGGATMTDSGESGVHVGRPTPGAWDFKWEKAKPRQSTLAIFGDTQFFLDMFPPQLRGNRLAVGATLARGADPLRGGEVWVEPIPGVMPDRLVLYDDGLHGDGRAGDGVYGNVLDFGRDVPESFDATVRAAGRAWDLGSFVRQAHGLTIRSGEPPPPKASLEGELDFGILYPGETGTAVATVDLQSHAPLDLDLHLGWDGAEDWPELSSGVSLAPGKRALELEMTVPESAQPGDYLGRFGIGDGGELHAESTARVKVGSVRFEPIEAVDFGVIPPGTFVSRRIAVPYRADKKIALRAGTDGGDDLTLNEIPGELNAGAGTVSIEAVVSVPMNGAAGDYSGSIELAAGPGRTSVPLRWQVKQFAAKPLDLEPVAAPKLGDAKPLEGPSGPSDDLWKEDEPAETAEIPSPWKKVEDIFDGDRPPVAASNPGTYDFDKVRAPSEKKESFWSAWWVYILAALLLLLLLLLILAYILYRLGKSALARFLLASAIANVVMLAVFIALLSTSLTDTPKPRPSIMVNLVESDPTPTELQLSETEKAMLDNAGANSAASASRGGGPAAAAAAQLDASASSGANLPSEKTASLPEGVDTGLHLAELSDAEPMPLKSEEPQPMTRRERRLERRNQAQPTHDIADMAEPPKRNEQQRAEREEPHRDVGETRLVVEAAAESSRAVWSDGMRPHNAITRDSGAALEQAPGAVLEKVTLDRLTKRLDPKGRRSNTKDSPIEMPEPRVQIDDPARDSLEVAARSDSEQAHAEPGVSEVRVEARALGPDVIGRKPGAILPPGVSELVYARLDPMPRGAAGGDLAVNTAPLGERRSERGSGARTGSALPGRESNRPGLLSHGESGIPGGSSTGRVRGGDSGATGEQRFDGAAGGGPDGGLEGVAGGTGSARNPSSLAGGGSSPSPLAGGGSTRLPKQAFGGGGGGMDDRRGQPRRGNGNGAGDAPGLSTGVPGFNGDNRDGGDGDGDTSLARGNGGDGRSSGRGRDAGAGEGRYDGMAGLGSVGVAQKGEGRGEYGVGSSDIGSGTGGAGLDIISLETEDNDWKRNERRLPKRAVNLAASSVDMDSLLIVLGDFARLPDKAAENLISSLHERLGQGLTVEERVLSPNDPGLNDCLLALATPEEVRDWSDDAVAKVAAYLKSGGHLWLDASRTDQARAFMSRLTRATGGSYDELPASHQINDDEIVDALHVDGRIAAVVTYQDWRRDWRHGRRDGGDRTTRFLVRGLNYFLSGDAETGISLAPEELKSRDLYIEPSRERMPDSVAGAVRESGKVWDEFGPETAATWRMPAWSDPGRLSAISDGQGGRALKLDLGAAKKGRAAAYRTLSPPQDFSRTDRISFDAFYDGEGEAAVSMVFTVRDYDGWSDYETPTIALRRGWNALSFGLRGNDFRALSDDGEEDRTLPGSAQAGRVGFFVYREANAPGVALFRNVRLHE